jgi:hypothetical protein
MRAQPLRHAGQRGRPDTRWHGAHGQAMPWQLSTEPCQVLLGQSRVKATPNHPEQQAPAPGHDAYTGTHDEASKTQPIQPMHAHGWHLQRLLHAERCAPCSRATTCRRSCPTHGRHQALRGSACTRTLGTRSRDHTPLHHHTAPHHSIIASATAACSALGGGGATPLP